MNIINKFSEPKELEKDIKNILSSDFINEENLTRKIEKYFDRYCLFMGGYQTRLDIFLKLSIGINDNLLNDILCVVVGE